MAFSHSSIVFAEYPPVPLDVAAWVRLVLTGSSSSATPDTGTIALLFPGVMARVNALYPACLALAPGSLSGADLAAYNEAIGYRIASIIAGLPGGQQYAQYVTENKQGTVTQKFGRATQSTASASASLRAGSDAALARISCVAESLASGGAVFSLTGARRTNGCRRY